MAHTIAINGFGRIGRMVLRAIIESGRSDEFKVVAINDLAPPATLLHLLKYDSAHGPLQTPAHLDGKTLHVGGHEIEVCSRRDPAELPWAEHGVDIVMECTGLFLTQEAAGKHLAAGAKRVVISAPAKDETKTIVYGINDSEINASDTIVSNASCTTNALAPLLQILHNNYGVVSGMMTTIHAYTGDQPTQDSPHKDLYRGRAAAVSMIPTTTGAAKAIGKVIPAMIGKLDGMAIRVPVPNVSMVDLTITIEGETTVEDIQQAFKKASQGELQGVLGYVDEKLVSTDLNHNPNSTNFIEDKTFVQGGNLVRVMSWYDNEWGFSNRMLDTASIVAKFI